MKFRIIRVDLPLRHVFSISRYSVSVVRTIIVELEQDGLCGHGEAYENPYYGSSIESMIDILERARPIVEGYALADPDAFWRTLAPVVGHCRFAQSAMDIAACDLWGKMHCQPLWQVWNSSLSSVPITGHTIGTDSLIQTREKFQEYPDWLCYTLKLGSKNESELLDFYREVIKVPVRFDVNGGWSRDVAMRRVSELESTFNVELIEQPLPANDLEGMLKLRKKANVPLIADESWRTPEDLALVAKYFDGVNIKLVKCGGLTPARWIIAEARRLGLKIMLGNSVESTVGGSATAQLAPEADWVNCDGQLLVEKKVGTGIEFDRGKVIFPNEDGTGVDVSFR
ncbi:MAG: dipeptide epimerase [Thermoguttaceae bacterium]